MKKDKIFFFADYEGIRQALGQSFLVTVPDANARNGIVNGANVGVDPKITGVLAQVSGNSQRPAHPNKDGTPSGLGTATTVGNQVIHEDYLLARADWTISTKDSLFGRYVSDIAQANSPTSINYWPVSDHNHNQFATIQERHIFSPTLLNQFSVSFTRPLETERALYRTRQYPAGFPDAARRDHRRYGLTSLGANFTNPFRFLENKFTEEDDLLWTKGSHSLKIGMHVRRHQINSYSYTYWNGQSRLPRPGDFLQGKPSLVSERRPETPTATATSATSA